MKRTKFKRLAVILLIFFALPGCSVIEQIAEYNLDQLYVEREVDTTTTLSLPSSTYIKDTIELSMENPTSLNPLDPSDYSVDQVLKLVNEPLLSTNESFEFIPKLAESYEKIGEKLYRFHLKRDIRFHNGLSFEAKDVLFSYEYIAKNPDSSYSYILDYIESLGVVDAYTVEITFKSIDYYNLYAVTFPIISKEYVSSSDYQPLKAVGTGPYQFTRFQNMITLELNRNEAYYGTKPIINAICVNIIRAFKDSYNMFVAKRIDVFGPYITTWSDYSDDKSIYTAKFDSPFFYYIGINQRQSLLGDIDARKLVASYIPYAAIEKNAFLNNINLTTLPVLPVHTFSNKIDPYYGLNTVDSFYMREYNESKKIDYIEALRKKEYVMSDSEPVVLNLIYNTDEFYQQRIVDEIELQTVLYPIAIECTGLNTQAYFNALYNNEFDLFIGTLKVSLIPNLVSIYGTTGNYNFGGYTNANLDGLLETYRKVSQDEQFNKQLENLSKVVASELPIIPLGFLDNGLFIHDQINGFASPNYFELYQDLPKLTINNLTR